MNELFRKVSHAISILVGSSSAFICALLLIILWAVTGPFFNFSNTWQLIINTSTTILTFLMVFLIQNTQNRDATAIHLKLDELLRGTKGARTSFVELQDLTDHELRQIEDEFEAIAAKYKARSRMMKHSGTYSDPKDL